MSIRTTTKSVVASWAGVPSISNTLVELCVLRATGHPGLPCGPALQPLIGDLKQAFPLKNLSGLRPSDMMGSGSIKTVELLISFIASSPSNSQPFALVTTDALARMESAESKPRRGRKRAAKSSKKAAKKSGKAGGGKAGGKKGGKGGGR